MRIIDFEHKGNVVRFYLGRDDDNDYHGDDWDDVPYECNAGVVYDEYVVGHRDIAFPFEYTVLEPSNLWDASSSWCKDDMKQRKVPCIIAIKDNDGDLYRDNFNHYMGASSDDVIKFYFGDKMAESKGFTAFTGKECLC